MPATKPPTPPTLTEDSIGFLIAMLDSMTVVATEPNGPMIVAAAGKAKAELEACAVLLA